MEEVEVVSIKKLGVISFANTFAVINIFIGLIFGIFFAVLNLLVSSLFGSLQANNSVVFSFGLIGILIFIIVTPVSFGIAGWINGALMALFYNFASKFTNGIQLYA